MSAFADPDIDLTPAQVAALLTEGSAQVIDVREGYEREAGFIEGTRHVELERLASQSETIDRERPVIFCCRLGARSAMAARAFDAAGWDAHHMAGGITAWDADGLPLAPDGGYVAEH